MMRLIDADALKKLILEERDKIPFTVPAAPYELVKEKANTHGNAVRGGIRKALRCMEQTPTIEAEPVRIDGNTSDGYHTFNELYHHRAVLFSVIVKAFHQKAWKSRKHHDGTMYDGMFIVGIETLDGQATYHYDLEPYWDMFNCNEVEFAPEWDGHTPQQAIERIGKLEPVVHCKDCKSFKEYTPGFKASAECVEGADGDCITRLLYSDAHPQFSAVKKCDYCSFGAKMDLEG